MAERELKTRIGLRRDLESNYSSTFQPKLGEVLLVDTEVYGLRVKIGDGVKTYANLDFVDKNNNVILNGYYLNGKFYKDSTYQVELEKDENKIYIDKNAKQIYIYNDVDSKYHCIDEMIATATDAKAGLTKLYKTSGQNEDGSMTQKAITDGIDDVAFAVDDSDPECLILNKPW